MDAHKSEDELMDRFFSRPQVVFSVAVGLVGLVLGAATVGCNQDLSNARGPFPDGGSDISAADTASDGVAGDTVDDSGDTDEGGEAGPLDTAPADTSSQDTGPGDTGPSDGGDGGCTPPATPRCQGGTVVEERSDAGCPLKRCQCPEGQTYNRQNGKCVEARGRGSSCQKRSDCGDGLVCDTNYLGTRNDGVCVPTCRADRLEACPGGWACHVPGDVAGFCLPKCPCENPDPCGAGRTCKYNRTGSLTTLCFNDVQVTGDDFTCSDPKWCRRACDRLSQCKTGGLNKTACQQQCDGAVEAICTYGKVREVNFDNCSAARSCLQ